MVQGLNLCARMTISEHMRPFGVLLAAWLATPFLAEPPHLHAQERELTETRRVEIAETLMRSTVVVRVGQSGGSGFVASREGWIITNAHVIRGNGRYPIQIRYGDRHETRARVIALDREHDLALLEPEGEHPTPALVLADPDGVRVGQTVLAFGSPFGLDGTLTQGIVSARRDIPANGRVIEGVIQTDAPINPGNSGGPLANSSGHVIGVNTAILSRTGGSHGIGFAMPSSYVRELIASARRPARVAEREAQAQRSVRQATPDAHDRLGPVWLGIFGDDFSDSGVRGVRIQRVIPGGPAETAGLRGAQDPAPLFVRQMGVAWTGHIIIAVDGEPVTTLDELKDRLDRHQPGENARLTLSIGPNAVRGEAVVPLRAPPAQLPQP